MRENGGSLGLLDAREERGMEEGAWSADLCGSGVIGVGVSLSRAEGRPGGDCMCRRIGERMRV